MTDNGPGIAPQYHERIWGIFQTLAARDKVEGTGIGLSVVQKIVESAGGTSLSSQRRIREPLLFRLAEEPIGRWPSLMR